MTMNTWASGYYLNNAINRTKLLLRNDEDQRATMMDTAQNMVEVWNETFYVLWDLIHEADH